GRALDQRVTGRKLGAREVIGKDAVFDRAEQRGDHPEQEQGYEQDRHRAEPEASNGNERHADLAQLEVLRDHGLVVAVGELAAERRQEKVGRDEDGGGERDQRFPVRNLRTEEDQEDQRVLEEVVAECREELAQEQRQKTAGGEERQQGCGRRGHGV